MSRFTKHRDQDDVCCYENKNAPWPWGPVPSCLDCERPISHHDTKRPVALCQRCLLIDFAVLRCPTADDLRDLGENGDDPHPTHFNAKSSVSDPVSCGTLRRIRDSSSTCAMCRLIWKVIVRNNYGEEPALIDESVTDRERECFIKFDIYGKFSDAQCGPFERSAVIGVRNLVRRLSLRIGVPPADDEDDVDCYWWDIMFCMQAAALLEYQTTPAVAWRTDDSRSMYFAGRRRPLKIDVGWIREWLRICEAQHGGNCLSKRSLSESVQARMTPSSQGRSDTHPGIRLINVISRCIESFTAEEDSESGVVPAYAALSYVWGKNQRLKLFQANEVVLSQEGALRVHRPSETIVDAIDLVDQLSLPALKHLWVDALCIVQDSLEDKKRQIGKMGEIYTNAAFTIMAAAGEDADAGLPGLRTGSRSVSPMVVPVISPRTHVQGNDGMTYHEHGLLVMETLNPLMGESGDYWTYAKYSTRGWCMQEKVLSRRNTIFTEEQVYFECAAGMYCEESIMECAPANFQPAYTGTNVYSASVAKLIDVFNRSAGQDPVSRSQSLTSSESFWGEFSALANRFSSLEFTFEGDVLDGFSGITQTISASTGEDFLWGMPTSRFGLSLLWEDSDDGTLGEYQMKRRTDRTTLPVTSVQKRLKYPTWTWLAWTGGVGLNLLDDRGVMRVPEVICYTTEAGGISLTEIGSKVQSKFPWMGRADEEGTHIAQQLPGLYNLLPQVPEGILLLFWTSVSSFRIGTFDDIRANDGRLKIFSPKPPSTTNDDFWSYRKGPIIDNEQHYWVGSLYSKGDREHNASLYRRNTEEVPADTADYVDFIVVGRIAAKRVLSSQPRSPIVVRVGWPVQDPATGQLNDVAMRQGLGTINEEAWVASRPKWRLVALG